ncbi:hypothetical protein RFN57_37605 [Streptomyces violaceochromogenes]|uniref:Uncharacterized protein n=1 Tax=Streptomyces violaceochromogenes TaxID=67377 RepID=A0ABU6M843_9ACTN|nr:hypothetical protein [Streptomyces violaceochromogenes]MEC7057964.1 hypothetical protein [Streptomyces violaceochromogenes]GHC50887.1 hypothetical protein GCM10010309_07430 [Streptomyces violaceochromogenes]
MTQAAAGSERDERVQARRWIVRLDPVGRGSAEVRVSCGRPACAERRLPSAAAGRTAAVAHLKAHLHATPAPRADTYCACRADGCRAHLPDTGRHARTEQPWRCGGPIVLAVITDRAGRWWQALECCSRCAAATPGAQTAATSRASAPRTAGRPTPAAAGTGAGTPHFSDQQVTTRTGCPAPLPVATPRPVPARRRRPPEARIGRRVISRDLRPVSLRDELTELGDLFRAYQKRPEPDLALLADLQERKARAFLTWSDVSCDATLRLEAQRAEQAAAVIRRQHQHRTGCVPDGDEPGVARLLTVPAQWEYLRSVLAHVAGHTPLPGAEARLLVLMLTLRTAHTGTGNLVGQDVNALGLTDPEDLVEQLTGCGWLSLPGTVGDLLASRPENPAPVTVPSLVPDEDGTGPFTFGRKTRPKLSGWAQRVVSDKKLRKAKAPAGARLLAVTLATWTDDVGRLGRGQGVTLNALATRVPVGSGELRDLIDRLTAADWLTDAALTDTHLTGRLTERVLPLTCPLLD